MLAVKLYENGFVREPFLMGGEGREDTCRCYDSAEGAHARCTKPETLFEDLPGDWICPRCKKPKNMFGKA